MRKSSKNHAVPAAEPPKAGHRFEEGNTAAKDHWFEKGNTLGKGRPQGSRNGVTVAIQNLIDGEGEAITRKAIELAMKGDTTAMRLVIERLIPVARDRRLSIELPPVKDTQGISDAMSAVLESVGKGEITPTEAQTLSSIIDSKRKSLETLELERRLQAVEQKIGRGQT